MVNPVNMVVNLGMLYVDCICAKMTIWIKLHNNNEETNDSAAYLPI